MVELDDAELYRKYADELMRYASALAGPGGAEDLFASAFLAAIASPGWKGVDNKRAYLYRVVLHEAIRFRRSTDRRLRREQHVATSDRHDPSSSDIDVVSALRRLSVRQRAVVFLTYWADLAPAAVAATIDSSERTVERELARAKQRLETFLS